MTERDFATNNEKSGTGEKRLPVALPNLLYRVDSESLPNPLPPIELHLNYAAADSPQIFHLCARKSEYWIPSDMGTVTVSIYERVKSNGKWTRVHVRPPQGRKRDGKLFLKDDRQGKFQLSWYENRQK